VASLSRKAVFALAALVGAYAGFGSGCLDQAGSDCRMLMECSTCAAVAECFFCLETDECLGEGAICGGDRAETPDMCDDGH
jgi:hypothetical protein